MAQSRLKYGPPAVVKAAIRAIKFGVRIGVNLRKTGRQRPPITEGR